MGSKLNSLLILTKKRINDIFSDITFYILCSLLLIINYIILSSFLTSIGTSGLDNSVSSFIIRVLTLLEGTFGTSAAVQIFSKGPILFSFFLSCLIAILYSVILTLIKLGHETSTGTTELYLYSPINIKVYYLSFLIKDILIFIFIEIILIVFYLIISLSVNLFIDVSLFINFALLFFLFIDILAIGLLLFAVIKKHFATIFIWLSIISFFAVIQVNAISKKEGFLHYTSLYFSNILGWINPFSYYFQIIDHLSAQRIFLSLSLIIVSIVYGVAFISFSLLYLDRKGL
jgi:hypothetical protein